MKFKRTILLVPLFLLACSLVTPRAFPPPTSFPFVTVTSPSTTVEVPTESPVEAPTSPPAVTLSAADFTPILYRNYFSRYYEFQVIGGVQAGSWLPASAVADQVGFDQAFDLYAPSGFAGVATTEDYGVPLDNPRCGDTFIGTDFSQDLPNLIAVKQGWNVGYRPWREIPVDTPVYYAAVADWLASQGLTLPYVQINRIVLVDLERDGVDEVIISAAYFNDASGHMAEQGDYSIVLMRKLVGADVVTIPVAADLYTNPEPEQVFPFTYTLANLLDLNQDGVLDLIVEVSRWEGDGVIIYDVEGTLVSEAIRAVCFQ